MQRATIGIRVHSGWGALVAIRGQGADLEVVARRRAEIIEPGTPGAAQPFHFVEDFAIAKAQVFLEKCAAVSRRLALSAMEDVVEKLRAQGCTIAGIAILLSSGRPLPALDKILASHAMIHTAEGEFFREAFRNAGEALKIPVTGVRERDLESQARTVFGKTAPAVQKKIAELGKTLGPPWTADQKLATLAAALIMKP